MSGPAVSQWLSGTTKPGEAQRAILAERYGIPVAVWDLPHVSAEEPEEARHAPPKDLAGQVDALERAVQRTLVAMAGESTPLEQAKLARECATTLEKIAKLKNEDPITLRKLLKSSLWASVEAAHRKALTPYPEAASALARELRLLDSSDDEDE